MGSALLEIGKRIRSLRESKSITRKELSDGSGLSLRFLANVESGKGNISMTRFFDVASALGVSPSSLLKDIGSPQPKIVALLGVRGAGKTTLGQALSKSLSIEFVEIDKEIEKKAGLTLSQLFDVHGETYYRSLEGDVLKTLFKESKSLFIATGGSIVNHAENFTLLKKHCLTVWLKADPIDHWNRVIKQGDKRPMHKNPKAYSELCDLLDNRKKHYRQSDLIVDTSKNSKKDALQLIFDHLDSAKST